MKTKSKGNSRDRAVRAQRVVWLVAGIAAGAAILARRKWFTVNDVTTGSTPEYPGLDPQRFDASPSLVLEAVRRAVRRMARWKVLREDVGARLVEAEARTILVGLTTVSIWIEPAAGGSLVLIRSRSRGRGDLGANARTIRALQRAIDREVRALREPGRIGRPDPGVGVMPAAEGSGPLLQRQYTGRISGSTWTPEELMMLVRTDMERLSAPELARFQRPPRDLHPLKVDDDIEVHIKGAGETHVRVAHVDERSLTLRTMDDHIEAGRITFGVWREDPRTIVFRIRSRARQAAPGWLIGFVLGGMALQQRIWESFIERAAEACGGTIEGEIQVVTRPVDDDAADRGDVDTPTFEVPDSEETDVTLAIRNLV
jgi:hypothetical protein